jgi:predicted phage-related endonuclease
MHPNATIHSVGQGTDEWHEARRGLLTASEVGLIVTPTLKTANNDNTRKHVYEIAAQRISGYTEPTYIGDDMLRGHVDEIKARDAYSEYYAPVEELGFVTRDIGGAVIGYSPDGAGVMGNFGIECKSRRQKYQIQVIADNEIPKEHILQVQTGLLVTG